MAAPLANPTIPEALRGIYRVEETLGAGAMGVVYRATHLALARPVAIKLPTLAGAELIERFVREGRVMAALEHPNLVRVHDAGTADGRPYLVLEFVRGRSLSTLLACHRLRPQLAVALLVQLLNGLGYAHSRGVCHRDVKSDNALVTDEGVLKLADFGIARSDSVAGLTQAGMILGTPAYMSPEQARGEVVDARSDLYSAAIVLFELLAGRLPFHSDDPMDLLAKQLREPPPALELLAPGVPARVAKAVARGLAKPPEERFATAADFADCLRDAVGEAELERSAAGLRSLVAESPAEAAVVAGTTFLARESEPRHPDRKPPGPRRTVASGERAPADRPAGPTLTSRRRGPSESALAVPREQQPTAANPLPRSGARFGLGALLVGVIVVAGVMLLGLRVSLSGGVTAPPAPRASSPDQPVLAVSRKVGAIRIVSRPPGAQVLAQGNSDTGRLTPALLEGLQPGTWQFTLELAGHARVTVSANVSPGQTRGVEVELQRVLLPMPRNRAGYAEFRNPVDGSVLIAIPRGSFSMGSRVGASDEKPIHEARLSAYYIGKHEVTWKQYLGFCAARGRKAPGRPAWAGDDHPVINVSWQDAQAYCQWAELALPTEAQWEYAARGKNAREYPWGDQDPVAAGVHLANYCPGPSAADGFEYAAPVDSYGPGARPPRGDGSSPVGALNMAGNVWEWCSDFYGASYYRVSGPGDPAGPDLLKQSVFDIGSRVRRGGSWLNNDPAALRVAARDKFLPAEITTNTGFRVARSFP